MKLHETNHYQDELFPVGCYQVTPFQCIPHGRGYQDLHWHEELQYVSVTKGSVTFQVNGKNYSLEKDDILFINKNILHMSISMSQDAYYISLNFPEKLLHFFENSRLYYKFVQPYTSSYNLTGIKINDDQLTSILKQIYTLLSKKDQEYEIAILIAMLWNQSLKHFKTFDLKQNNLRIIQQKQIQDMLTYIHQNYQHQITLKNIANIGNISIASTNRLFKSMIDQSPYDYLIHYRLLKSVDYLLETSYNINEIAYKVGFTNTNHFIQTFKRKYHLTPKKYKQFIFQTTNTIEKL